ncbi:unnamed protein product [Rotaria sp. Silwood2]|nr:unnamed protein product [Rotaria sp. Silwood2]CAF4039902.1 unnamed protein product [Rotaria sp. Silwood2]CAF4048043.1 unnamed protein product [Rotaria sp. Silwood2]
MTEASNHTISNKSSLDSDTKTSPPMSVMLELDEINELLTVTSIKQPSRNKSLESLIIHEIQSWSSFIGASVVEQLTNDIDKSPKYPYLSKNPRNQSLIDRNKQYYYRHDELTWLSLFGTMPDINQILTHNRFLYGHPWLQNLIVFIDSYFRGVGQVIFANNPLSGLVITVGLLIGQWQLALYDLLGTITSTLTAYIIELDYGSIRTDLYEYNGCLTDMTIANFSFGFRSPLIIGPILLMSAYSTIFLVALRLDLSPFTFSSQMCSLLWLLGAMKFRYFFVDETLLTPGLLSTFIEKPSLSNLTITKYSVIDIFTSFPTSASQVYFINNPLTGIIILLGILICSSILSLFALFGAITGQLSAANLFGLPVETIRMSLLGCNSVLTCQALGGMFFVLSGYPIWIFTLFGSIMSVIAQTVISVFLSPIGIPSLLLPSILISWIFCLMAESRADVNLIDYDLRSPLHLAACGGKAELCLMLVKNFRANVNLIDEFGETPLYEAFCHGNFHLISFLYACGARMPVSKTKELTFCLCAFSFEGNLNAVQYLVACGVNPNSTDYNGRTALHLAVCGNNFSIVKYLVEENKASLSIADYYNQTPIQYALHLTDNRIANYLQYCRD